MEKKEKVSEKEGMKRFAREMVSALGMAFIFIVYIIQAFKIPTGSMENSLLVGDFLLGLKFVYGAPVVPFSYTNFPGLTSPKPGDVVIFEYPGNENKDYIKRCVAGPGQTIEIKTKDILIDGKVLNPPPNSKYVQNGLLGPLQNYATLRIPAKGDTIKVGNLDDREFLFLRNLIKQEYPKNRVTKFISTLPILKNSFNPRPINDNIQIDLQLYIDGKLSNDVKIPLSVGSKGQAGSLSFNEINEMNLFDQFDVWFAFSQQLMELTEIIKRIYPEQEIEIIKGLELKGEKINEYVVKDDNYFMIGDNRDNSMDSRFWGYVNKNFVKAKAFILYFSLDEKTPYALLPLKIRWNRIGKLIRSWDGGLDGKEITHGTNKPYKVKK